MKIQPLEKNIKSLIGDQSSYFSIPDYQRPYRWGEEHIGDFWNDITTAYDSNEENYFLGSLILVNRGSDFEVVDGQQRLTTILIFLAVLRDHFARNEKTDVAEKIQNEFICKDGKYRLQLRPEDRANFEEHVLKEILSLDGTKNSSLGTAFLDAVRFMKEYIAKKESEVSKTRDPIVYTEGLYEYFMNKTLVVQLVAEDLSSAYTIFETINHRGEELETDELLKNFLLKRMQEEITRHNRQNPQSQKNFDDEKQVLLEGYKRIREISGKKVKMQELLRYHWTAAMGVKPRKNLYKEIISHIKAANTASSDFVREWKHSSECYDSISPESQFFKTLSPDAKNAIKCLNICNHKEWIPALISARRNGYGKEDFERIVLVLERFYSLFWIAGYGAGKVKNPTISAIREYLNEKKSVDELERFAETALKRNRVFGRAKEALSGECYGESWCRMILAKYEYSLTDESVNKEIDFSKTQVEHVLPQTMTDDSWKEEFTGEEHDALVNTVGNLALLIGGVKEKRKSKNQTASNKPFAEKKKIYMGKTLNDGKSAFQMVQDLERYEKWTPETIAERGRKISDELKRQWKIPEIEAAPAKFQDAGNAADEDSEYTDTELKDILLENLGKETRLAPRIAKFLEILLSENRPFSREEIKEKMFDFGVGETSGKCGTYLSNISQAITDAGGDYLRQILSFESDGTVGSLKDNYAVKERYRDMVRDVIETIRAGE